MPPLPPAPPTAADMPRRRNRPMACTAKPPLPPPPPTDCAKMPLARSPRVSMVGVAPRMPIARDRDGVAVAAGAARAADAPRHRTIRDRTCCCRRCRRRRRWPARRCHASRRRSVVEIAIVGDVDEAGAAAVAAACRRSVSGPGQSSEPLLPPLPPPPPTLRASMADDTLPSVWIVPWLMTVEIARDVRRSPARRPRHRNLPSRRSPTRPSPSPPLPPPPPMLSAMMPRARAPARGDVAVVAHVDRAAVAAARAGSRRWPTTPPEARAVAAAAADALREDAVGAAAGR